MRRSEGPCGMCRVDVGGGKMVEDMVEGLEARSLTCGEGGPRCRQRGAAAPLWLQPPTRYDAHSSPKKGASAGPRLARTCRALLCARPVSNAPLFVRAACAGLLLPGGIETDRKSLKDTKGGGRNSRCPGREKDGGLAAATRQTIARRRRPPAGRLGVDGDADGAALDLVVGVEEAWWGTPAAASAAGRPRRGRRPRGSRSAACGSTSRAGR